MTAAARRWREADAEHIDVRGLAPPAPLVEILTLVDALAAEPSPVIVVHHDRDPRLLYPELAERGWQVQALPGDPGEVRLRLTRAP
jgi:Uncharacterized conserved protein (DUF2249)